MHLSRLAAVQEGRRARNAFVAVWNAAVEGHQAGAARPPRLPEGVPAMHEVPGREHRSRYTFTTNLTAHEEDRKVSIVSHIAHKHDAM